MNNILLSIIIPVFNVEQFLRKCLDSIFANNVNFGEVEIICVNDGSTDSSPDILLDYKTKFQDLIIINKTNGGLSDARNSGLIIASGKYIYFLDSDDFLIDNSLNSIITILHDWNLDIYCFNCILSNTNSLYFNVKYNPTSVMRGKDYISEFYHENNFFPPSPVCLYIYRKGFLLEKNLSFLDQIFHEDELFTPQALVLAKKIKLFNFPIFCYTIGRENSIMNSQNLKHINDLLLVNRHLHKFFVENDVKDNLYFSHLIFNYLNIIEKITNLGYLSNRNKIILKEDFRIISLCVNTWDWYLYFFLFLNNMTAFRYYTRRDSSRILTRGLSYFIRFIKPLQYLRLRFRGSFPTNINLFNS